MASKLNDKAIVIVGGGPAGYQSALELRAQFSEQEIILIEKNKLGGACLHVGCIPSKMLHTVKSLADYPKMLKKNRMILEKGIAAELKEANVRVINAEAALNSEEDFAAIKSQSKIKAGDEEIEFSRLIIATGSKPRTLADYPDALNSDSFFTEENAKALASEENQKFCFIGGGYIGIELASMLAAHGKKVRIVEMLDEVLPFLDSFIRDKLLEELKRSGLEVQTGVKDLKDANIADDEQVFVSIGRDVAHFDKLIELSKDADNIHVLGDANRELALAHYAYYQARELAYKLAGKEFKAIDKRNVPAVIFSHPEVASIGYNSEEAKQEFGDDQVEEKLVPWASNGKARISGNERGHTKWVIHKKGKILGCSIIGNGASDLISIIVPIINQGLTIEDTKAWVYPHPTLGEIFAF